MTIAVANTGNTNSFYYWLSRTNELAHAMSNYVITTNSNNTTGNAYVNGTFSATTLTANTALRGGNVSTSAVLTISSNVDVTGTKLTVGNVSLNALSVSVGNASINTTSIGVTGYAIFSINVQTSNTSSQVIDSFSITSFRTAEYVISLKNNAANAHQASKLLIIHSDGDAYVTEYGVVATNTSLGSFSANANSTHCRLLFTPTAANTQVKGVRTNVVV